MAARQFGRYAVRALLVLIAGFVVFDFASAYAIARGVSFYVALAIGLAACPVAPLVWHALGERRRKRKRATMKTPPKSTTTGLERLLLRAGVVGVAVIAALVGLTNESWNAVRHHGLWFVPRAEPKLHAESPLLALVPSNAEAVWWIRPTQAASDALTTLGADAALLETVYAIGPHEKPLEAVLVTRFPGELPAPPPWVNALGIAALPPLTIGPIANAFGPVWRATRGWVGAIASGPPSALLTLIERAPEDSIAVMVAKTARASDPGDTLEVVAYATLRGSTFEVAGDAQLTSVQAATRFRADVDSALASARTLAFTTVSCLQSHGATLELTTADAHVQLHATVDVDAVRACLPLR